MRTGNKPNKDTGNKIHVTPKLFLLLFLSFSYDETDSWGIKWALESHHSQNATEIKIWCFVSYYRIS